jgi:hypothetical protein
MERHIQTGDSRPDRRDPKTRVLLNDLIDLGGLTSLSNIRLAHLLIDTFSTKLVVGKEILRRERTFVHAYLVTSLHISPKSRYESFQV